MKLADLPEYLERECYNSVFYHVGPGWEGSPDTVCIDKFGAQFEVFYVERGQKEQTMHRGKSEAAACKAFRAALDEDSISQYNCVGSSRVKAEMDTLAKRLTTAGIKMHRDAVPIKSATDILYRIFVFGRDKIRVG